MNRFLDLLLYALLAASGATFAWVIWTTPVFPQHNPMDPAHWYPYSCCNLRDCFPVASEMIEVTADGYVYILTGELIPFDRARITPAEGGGQFHLCTIGGDPRSRIIGQNYGDASCFWAPPQGF